MTKTISRDNPFTVPCDKFMIAGTSSGYTFSYSVDGKIFTSWEESTPPNTNQAVVGCPLTVIAKLEGNTDDNVLIRW